MLGVPGVAAVPDVFVEPVVILASPAVGVIVLPVPVVELLVFEPDTEFVPVVDAATLEPESVDAPEPVVVLDVWANARPALLKSNAVPTIALPAIFAVFIFGQSKLAVHARPAHDYRGFRLNNR